MIDSQANIIIDDFIDLGGVPKMANDRNILGTVVIDVLLSSFNFAAFFVLNLFPFPLATPD